MSSGGIWRVSVDDGGKTLVRPFLSSSWVSTRFDAEIEDWSRPQLEKHSREIQSLLGNYFLRVTSRKIVARAATAPHLSLQEIRRKYEGVNDEFSKALVQLMDLQRETPKKVRQEMENLEVAEALQHLIELMRVVCYH